MLDNKKDTNSILKCSIAVAHSAVKKSLKQATQSSFGLLLMHYQQVAVVCSIRLTSDNYTTTKPNTTTLNLRQSQTHRERWSIGLQSPTHNQTNSQTITNTHRVEPGEYQTDGQMATKPNTSRLKLRQSQTHTGLNLEYQTDGQMTNTTRLNHRQSQTHRGLNLESQTDGQMTTKPKTTRPDHRQSQTHRGLNLEFQTDSQMTTKLNTIRLNHRQSKTHRGLNLEYQTDGQMTINPTKPD